MRSAGFTIVELMIATVVFSTIMVVITTGVLYFTRAYYSSLNRSKVQNTARAITAQISQGIQFTGMVIATTTETSLPANVDPSGVQRFCAGGKVYAYRLNLKYDGGTATQANPGLYVLPQASGCTAVTNYNAAAAQQLLGPGMRLTNLTVTQSITLPRLYQISLTLAYGDDDLFVGSGSSIACKSQAGSQFCAVSTLNTTVQRRLQDSQLGH